MLFIQNTLHYYSEFWFIFMGDLYGAFDNEEKKSLYSFLASFWWKAFFFAFFFLLFFFPPYKTHIIWPLEFIYISHYPMEWQFLFICFQKSW